MQVEQVNLLRFGLVLVLQYAHLRDVLAVRICSVTLLNFIT